MSERHFLQFVLDKMELIRGDDLSARDLNLIKHAKKHPQLQSFQPKMKLPNSNDRDH